MECHNPNYTDYQLRQVSAYMMGLEEFSEADFEQLIEEIAGSYKKGNSQTAFPKSGQCHF